MKNTPSIALRLCCVLLAAVLVAGCSKLAPEQPTKYTAKAKQTNAYFATISRLSLYDDFSVPQRALAFEEVWEEIKTILQEVDNAASTSLETSDIARFNQLAYGESIAVSAHTARILQTAKEVYAQTDGLYDPTVFPLVDLWGFTPRFNSNEYQPTAAYDRPRLSPGFALPDPQYITGFLKLVNLDGVVLSGDAQQGYHLTKNTPPVTIDGITYQAKLDLGGVAKGYAVDLVVELLRSKGYEYGYFSCGSSSMGLLKNASSAAQQAGNTSYDLGIRKPRPGATQDAAYLSIATHDASLSTSGDYDHAYRVDEVLYCHLIDPRTGYPINIPADGFQKGVASVTLLGSSAAYDDAMTTALCAMGLQQAIAYGNEHLRGFQLAIALYHTGYDYFELVTNMPGEQYMITDENYRLASSLDSAGNMVYQGELMG